MNLKGGRFIWSYFIRLFSLTPALAAFHKIEKKAAAGTWQREGRVLRSAQPHFQPQGCCDLTPAPAPEIPLILRASWNRSARLIGLIIAAVYVCLCAFASVRMREILREGKEKKERDCDAATGGDFKETRVFSLMMLGAL